MEYVEEVYDAGEKKLLILPGFPKLPLETQCRRSDPTGLCHAVPLVDLAVAVGALRSLRLLREPGPFAARVHQVGVRVQAFRHLVTDDIHQALEHGLERKGCDYIQSVTVGQGESCGDGNSPPPVSLDATHLHFDVLLSRGLEEFDAQLVGELLPSFKRNDSFVLHITLVSH